MSENRKKDTFNIKEEKYVVKNLRLDAKGIRYIMSLRS